MERITQKIKIPVEYAEIDVNTSKEEISKLINSIIVDENFRAQFNKNPEKIFREAGISLDQVTIEKLKGSAITEMLKDSFPAPEETSIIAAIVVVGVIIGVIAPPKPAE